MKAYLNHEIPWESLVENYYRNYSECKKMYIIKKLD